MFNQPSKFVVLLITLLTLVGCVTHQAPDSTSKTVTSNDWTVTGKIAFISPEERVSANLHWRHITSTGNDRLQLTGPFGTNVLNLTATPELATVVVDDKTFTDNDVDRLIVKLTGWPLPLSQLAKYLLGQTAADHKNVSNKVTQSVIELIHPTTNSISELHYLSWQQINGYKIPKQIELRQDQQRIKLTINTWQPEL
ncbi:lipoprotein insertase outer membrane protein LolB [Ferrimonas lipolytica]|uniref:Outer-membrane lipoprotein LolB n=1 Tax=Ferrimonas lipolytica TaxID=2724191 RepID=A0A6H1UDA5_9GAMM|nr:lipoprotein insertase outer membrane protein LolB [Ferrimonas lipolytica]QIZ77087.1 outer membrane lipoprotein LolB [Ferrimonas lipolytica]